MLSILTSGMEPRLIFLALIAFVIAVMGAIVLHEFGHAIVAYWNGDRTAKLAGRLTLNPLRHADPLGLAMLLIAGIGWAKPVPINPLEFRNYKRGLITTSLAGVILNLILGVISFGGIAAVQAIFGTTHTSEAVYFFHFFLLELFVYGAVINLSLFMFNLIPIYPLDGFRLVETLARPGNRYVEFNYKYGTWLFLGLIVVSTVLGYISPYLDFFRQFVQLPVRLFAWMFGIPIFN